MKNGKLFVIEGTDGSGKQTQTEFLAKKLKEEKYKYMQVSFPCYDSPSSSLVKMYLAGEFGQNANDVSAYAASSFYALDRYAQYKKDFGKFYEDGGIIIADRYTTSNMIHQASKIEDEKEKEKFLDWLNSFEYEILKLPKPDLVIFLNMPTKYATQLMKDRENKITKQATKDIHEKDTNHLEHAYNNACNLAKKYNWKEINCIKNGEIRSIEDIHNEIYNIIKKCI